jgi:hypothetical protein
MAAFNKFHCLLKDAFEGKHNFAGDTIKVLLTNTAPVATNTIRSQLIEITAQNGYPAGGLTLPVTSSNQTNGLYRVIVSDITLTATGAIGPFRYIVTYNSTSGTNPLISWYDYGSSLTLNTGESFLFDFDNTNGLFSVN